jgi:hypothetical protein
MGAWDGRGAKISSPVRGIRQGCALLFDDEIAAQLPSSLT